MPRDQRLYMTFPNDFHRHPKVSRLTDAEFRAFVEMNGEARIADNDGVFPAEEAEFLWPQAVIDALVRSHPTRPLVVRDGDQYVIRDYSEHQQTRDERERLAEKNRQNGMKGGRPRKNPDETQSVTSGKRSEPNETQTKAESESESESELEDYSPHVNESSPVVTAHETTDSDQLSPVVQMMASQAGITSVQAIVDVIAKHTGREVTPDRAVGVAHWLLGKAKNPRVPQRYVSGAISRSPFEVQQYIDGMAS